MMRFWQAFLLINLTMLAGCASTPAPIIDHSATQAALATAEITGKATPNSAPNPVANPNEAGLLISDQLANIPAAGLAPVPQTPLTLLPPPDSDLWQRIRNGFRLESMDNGLVKEQEDWYASRPDYVRRMTERGQRYLYHIVEEVEKRGMPTEIALLPMIESAFNPKAYSRSHASGIWQFIPSTGRNYGLNQNWWYDGRRDILAATHAALNYLQRLHDMFGSWELALAAYNCGEGTVSRAIAANQSRGAAADFMSLSLPAETRSYVPKLMAVKNIIMNPVAYGLDLDTVPNSPYFVTVTLREHIDLQLAARLAGMTVEEFVALNPAFNRPVITAKQGRHLLLPPDKAEAFRLNLAKYQYPLLTWQAYSARRGERVDKIAKRFGIHLAELRSYNSVKERRNKLVAAQTLLVPLPHTLQARRQVGKAVKLATAGQPRVGENSSSVSAQELKQYIVQAGDTLFGVARQHGLTVEQIKTLNQLETGSLKPGQALVLTPPGKAAETSQLAGAMIDSSEPLHVEDLEAKHGAVSVTEGMTRSAKSKLAAGQQWFYKVRRGDTLHSIARAFKVAVHDLLRWNHMSMEKPLFAGSKLKIIVAAR